MSLFIACLFYLTVWQYMNIHCNFPLTLKLWNAEINGKFWPQTTLNYINLIGFVLVDSVNSKYVKMNG